MVEISIGSGIKKIGSGCFNGCTLLTNFSIKAGNQLESDIDISTGNFGVSTLVNLLNNLPDRTGKTAKTLTIGSTNLAKLSADQKAIATGKNWNLK